MESGGSAALRTQPQRNPEHFRVTARKALEVLFEQGLIRRNQGSGTFITPRLEQPLSRLSSFSEMLRLKGFTPGSTWLERGIALPTHDELIRLGLSPTERSRA